MNRKSIGGGAYKETNDLGDVIGYWARPWVNRRRTWRKLKATKDRAAIAEANQTKWESLEGSFAELADEYLEGNCPNRRLEPRPDTFVVVERKRIQHLKSYFGRYQPEEITIKLLPKYKAWRVTKLEKDVTGERTVDLDLVTLSNILNYAVAIGRMEFNFIRAGRPRYRRDKDVSHSRERAPATSDQVHAVARWLFQRQRSEVLGWQVLFEWMSGVRISELLRLRLDARNPDQPGFISGQYLFIRRSKGGVNPYILITPEMAEMIRHWQSWHKTRYPKSVWFFPGRIKGKPITATALNHGLNDAHESMGGTRITPHGLRSAYVTKRRGDGVPEVQICAEIGDKTVEILQTSYGDRPPNWRGEDKIEWIPKEGQPAWRLWSLETKQFETGGLRSGLEAETGDKPKSP